MERFIPPEITDGDVRWVSSLLGLPAYAFTGVDGLDPRLEALKASKEMDVEACPGSGKTTLLVAKLGIISRKWRHSSRGVCVLSHTNVARLEIETGLAGSADGQRLLAYPHYIGTIHGFLNTYLALPWIRSLKIPIRAIDDEICLNRRWSLLPANVRTALTNSNHDKQALRVRDKTFSVGDITWGRGTLGTGTDTYKAIVAACKTSFKEGFFCHDEMLIWTNYFLGRHPAISVALQWRFPLLFLDEVQDTSEEQAAVLKRIFGGEASLVVRQRFGDVNQAIFHSTAHKESETLADPFPAKPVVWPIPNSHRFGQQIADFANPLAIAPQDLKGAGPSRSRIVTDTDGKHAIFLFSSQTRIRVLAAYAEYLDSIFTGEELRRGTFTAVGAVHSPGGSEEKPRVSQYWPDYDHKLASADPKPASFCQYVNAGRKLSLETGEAFHTVKLVADAVFALLQLLDPMEAPRGLRRGHLQLLQLLENEPGVREDYLKLQARAALSEALPSKDEWEQKWQPVLQSIARCVVGADSLSAANDFLRWPDDVAPALKTGTPARDNIFKYPSTEPRVLVQVGSIHSVKGETHTGTLVLDTFLHKPCLPKLKPWLLGQKEGGAGEGVQSTARLKLHYVAMTRPTHLLCLAMHENDLSESERATLRERGWRIAQISADTVAWS